MLLYLTRKEISDLLDFTMDTLGLVPKKLIGTFSFMQFVIKDMRNFSHCKYLVIDRRAVIENDEELIQAINSYKTMYDSRIIIIKEGLTKEDKLIQMLVDSEVNEIVTAEDIEEIKAQVLECLSEKGMQRYNAQKAKWINEAELVIDITDTKEKYKFKCKNVTIAFIGSQRRAGTTLTAINLANWLAAVGARVSYVESNSNLHLQWIVNLYSMEPVGNTYRMFDVDYYMTKEIDRDYNFIIYDCGAFNGELPDDFVNADIRVVCGCAMPYEAKEYSKLMNGCKGMEVIPIGTFVPEILREFCRSHISQDIMFSDICHEMFNIKSNKPIYKNIISKYLSEAERI